MFNGETDSSYDNQRPGISGTEDANTKASNGIIGSKQFSHTKLSLQEYGTPRSSNQRGKNGSVTLKTDSDSTSLSNWVENGGITNENIAKKFLLKRAIYKTDGSNQVVWLCERNYKGKSPFH